MSNFPLNIYIILNLVIITNFNDMKMHDSSVIIHLIFKSYVITKFKIEF